MSPNPPHQFRTRQERRTVQYPPAIPPNRFSRPLNDRNPVSSLSRTMSNFFTLPKVPRTITASLRRLCYARKYLNRTNTRAFTITNTFNMPEYHGSCYCKEIKYTVTLDSKDQARTSICHCGNCRVRFKICRRLLASGAGGLRRLGDFKG
jgi:hypothetical protein